MIKSWCLTFGADESGWFSIIQHQKQHDTPCQFTIYNFTKESSCVSCFTHSRPSVLLDSAFVKPVPEAWTELLPQLSYDFDRHKEKKDSWLTHWEKYLSSTQNSSHKNPQFLQCLHFLIYKCNFLIQHMLLLLWTSYLCLLVVLLADAISSLRVTQNIEWYSFSVSNWDIFYQSLQSKARKYSISEIRNNFLFV